MPQMTSHIILIQLHDTITRNLHDGYTTSSTLTCYWTWGVASAADGEPDGESQFTDGHFGLPGATDLLSALDCLNSDSWF
jgi:hypothetical protein